MYRELVNENGQNLKHVPIELKTFELCETAVSQDGLAIEFVPAELMTEELCELAIRTTKKSKQKLTIFKFIPDELKTSETCIELVNANGQNLKHVPDRLKTFEVCKTAKQQTICRIRTRFL